MSSETRRRVLEYLVKEAQNGLAPVRDACNQFLRLGMKALEKPHVRKAIPRELVIKAFLRQNGKCFRCGEYMLLDAKGEDEITGDHTLAHSLGGQITKDNITAMHKRCNSSKGDNDLVEESKATGKLFNEIIPDPED